MKLEFIVAVVLCFGAVIGSLTYANVTQKEIFAKSMALAMEKGIDPMAVRCSYAETYDTVCIAYAASGKKAEIAPGMRPEVKK